MTAHRDHGASDAAGSPDPTTPAAAPAPAPAPAPALVPDTAPASAPAPGPAPASAPAPVDYWEDRYASSDRVWSGRVNRVLADVAATLAPGRALDLGCGEGADAIWLARQGWDATGVDISATAVRRATEAARSAGLDESHVRFVAADLAELPAGAYELVTASFLHSTVELPRTDILRRAAASVVPGGHLLITSHAEVPPWAGTELRAHAAHHRFLGPEEEIAELALDPEQWQTVVAETRTRETVGPDGAPATLDDTVVLLRRR